MHDIAINLLLKIQELANCGWLELTCSHINQSIASSCDDHSYALLFLQYKLWLK